ncbi:MAG TPA: hypothetical protein VLL97_11245 [Acidobacteriota bacterium]|nr:hypothetical protein [Acidobacteriota bacterium]
MNENEYAAIGHILKSALNDEPWKSLGFRRRPRSDPFMRKLRPAWKNRLEQLALRHIVSMFTTVAVLGGAIRLPALREVTERFADAYPQLGYENRNEAAEHLHDTIIRYVDADPAQWQKLLLENLNIAGLPDEKTASTLLLGVIRFSRDMRRQLEQLQQGPE